MGRCPDLPPSRLSLLLDRDYFRGCPKLGCPIRQVDYHALVSERENRQLAGLFCLGWSRENGHFICHGTPRYLSGRADRYRHSFGRLPRRSCVYALRRQNRVRRARRPESPAGARGRRNAGPRPRPLRGQGSKSAHVIALLEKSKGATLAELMKATGWQAHSVRGFLSGTLRKKMGLKIESTKRGGLERVYSISR